jgi:type I protein arginine methyltransferase
MAFQACRAGAARVYGLEEDAIVHAGRQAAVANDFADRIVFMRGKSTAIDLPERVDGIVADLRGVLPLNGSSLASMIDARTRFLKPGGWIVAARDTLWTALVSSQTIYDGFVKGWTSGHPFDYSFAREKSVNTWGRQSIGSADVFGEPQCWATLDYATIASPNVEGDAHWVVDQDACAHGVAVWFDTETAPGITLSNSPFTNERHVYRQAFFPWPQETLLGRGDRVHVRFRAQLVQGDYIWTWTTRVTDGTGDHSKAAYRQSNFFAATLSADRLQRRAHTFVAKPRLDASIDGRVLELMAEHRTLSHIADTILAEYPAQFRDWDAALARVGDLSERYSE